eukprot:5235403-Amphidinium_carterae.1
MRPHICVVAYVEKLLGGVHTCYPGHSAADLHAGSTVVGRYGDGLSGISKGLTNSVSRTLVVSYLKRHLDETIVAGCRILEVVG